MSKVQDLKVRISADIGQFNSKMKELSSSLQDSTKQFSGLTKAGEAVSGLGKKLMPLTVAIGGVATASAKTAIDFDSAMNKVSAVSGATGKDLDSLRELAKKMGSETKFSATECGSPFLHGYGGLGCVPDDRRFTWGTCTCFCWGY